MAIAATLTLLVAAPMAAHDSTSDPASSDPIPQSLVQSLRQGDRLFDHGLGVQVPRRGEAVWGHLHNVDGTSQTLFVRTQRSGEVAVRFWGDEGAQAGTGPAVGGATASPTDDTDGATPESGSECSTGSYYSYNFRVPDLRWRFGIGSTPTKFQSREGGTQGAIDAIIAANANITTANNNCGRADRISAEFQYKGTTWRRANITDNGSCGTSDGRSVISWGNLPSYSAAMACMMRISGGIAHEADIKLNWNKPYETSMSSCSGEFLIEAAMTHEFGHVYGLGHVSASSQTMNPMFGYCSYSHTTLGLGDMRGFERKY